MADHALVATLVGFAHALRDAGLTVGGGDVRLFCAAAATLDPADPLDVYWAGRTAMVTRRDDLPVYDAVFRHYFLGEGDPGRQQLTLPADERDAVFEVPATQEGDEDREAEQTSLGLVASGVETLRHKAFAACTDAELAALRKIMARMRLRPPTRRTRRTVRASAGRKPDLRRTVRESMRMHGDPAKLYWRRRRVRPRPVVLILDISGSMADYSRALLQFAHSTQRAAARVEVFCFGTRLTYLTRSLRTRRPDDALRRAAAAAMDWEGGTRIGASLDRFVRRWGRRGVSRGAIVVICSDGYDRGDPELLDSAMVALARLSHRVVWVNPHHTAGGGPSSVGMMVAAPHVDLMVSGRDLTGLAELADLLPKLG